MTKRVSAVFLMVSLMFSGCATDSGLTERETGGLAGAALGAGIGALAGSATGHAGVGTAIGEEPFVVKRGERIAQMVVRRVGRVRWREKWPAVRRNRQKERFVRK
ncbi:MAG: hypothetical protein BWY42_01358 [Candidatus Omnitrophica bacterium ADurb.Bin277]|nr:MAG: hypothetical protein BWY42_01358 [Candidatus Omnitrophica bacterium ADurb.Bin277]